MDGINIVFPGHPFLLPLPILFCLIFWSFLLIPAGPCSAMMVSFLLWLIYYAEGWRTLFFSERCLPDLFQSYIPKESFPGDLLSNVINGWKFTHLKFRVMFSRFHSFALYKGCVPWDHELNHGVTTIQPRLPLVFISLMISSALMSTMFSNASPLLILSITCQEIFPNGYQESPWFLFSQQIHGWLKFSIRMRAFKHNVSCSWNKKASLRLALITQSGVDPGHQMSLIDLIPNFNPQALKQIMTFSVAALPSLSTT